MDNRLAELRKTGGLSQEALAYSVGVSRQTINSLERNTHKPSLELAVKIARVFGLPVEEVFLVESPQPVDN